MRTPIGWTLRDTVVRRVVLETSAGWVIDRGMMIVDSLYHIDEEAGVDVEYAVAWSDPRLGPRIWINPNNEPVLPGFALGQFRLVSSRGQETWHMGDAALAIIERKLADWTGDVAS